MDTKFTLRAHVIAVSQDYLGPAAERFIDRQITTHLQKKPELLDAQDLKKLIDWIKLAFALLTQETKIVDEYIERLAALAKQHASSRT